MIMNPQTLVVGLGNTLRGDDALGRIAAERLRPAVDPNQVKVIDQCAPTPELAAEMSAVALVIFLDASADGPADRVVTRRLTESAAADSLAHRVDLGGLLGLARRLYGHAPEAYAVTFRGRSFDFSDTQLSQEAEAASHVLVREALRLIRACLTPSDFTPPGNPR
jgi:hydrogenase maturation protease